MSSPNTKIAICYWGLTRSTKHVYQTHETHVFDVLKNAGIEFDVFLHTWRTDQNRVWDWVLDTPLDPDEFRCLCPAAYQIDDQNEFLYNIQFSDYFYEWDRENEWSPELLRNHLCALESQKRVVNLCIGSNRKYTHVLFLRPDVRILNNLPITELFNGPTNQIVLPDNNHYEGYNDRFAVVAFENVLWYSHRINRAAEFRRNHGRIVSEKLVKHVVDTHYTPKFVEFRFVLVRSDLSVM